MDSTREIWRDIIGYEGYYQVSDCGNVKSLDRVVGNGKTYKSKILTLRKNIYGYCVVYLSKNCKVETKNVHRLVALSFIDNPHNKPQVNHINEIKHDNKVNNLEWMTSKENTNHGTGIKRKSLKLMKDLKKYETKEIRRFEFLRKLKIRNLKMEDFSEVFSGIKYCGKDKGSKLYFYFEKRG